MDQEFGLVVFDETHEAIKSETLVKAQQIKARALTTPGQITAGCGLSLRFALADLPKIKAFLKTEQIHYQAVYHGERHGLQSDYQLLFKYEG